MGAGGIKAYATDPAHDFTRYQIILDRAPFGAMSAGADAAPPGFSTRYQFVGTAQVAINEPIMAIIIDKEGNRVYFKAEGDGLPGGANVVKIERADKAPAKLVLKQGLETATLVLEPKAGTAPVPGAPAPAGQPGQPGQPPQPGSIQPGVRRIPFHRG